MYFSWHSSIVQNVGACTLHVGKFLSNDIFVTSSLEFDSCLSRTRVILTLFLFNLPQSSIMICSLVFKNFFSLLFIYLRIFSIFCCMKVYWSSFSSSQILSSAALTLQVRPQSEFFISSIKIFSPVISVWIFLIYNFISSWVFFTFLSICSIV